MLVAEGPGEQSFCGACFRWSYGVCAQVRLNLASREAQAAAPQQQPIAASSAQNSPDGEVAVTATLPSGQSVSFNGAMSRIPSGGMAGGLAASLKLSGISAGGVGPMSPVSPSASKNTARAVPILGEDKIAELR